MEAMKLLYRHEIAYIKDKGRCKHKKFGDSAIQAFFTDGEWRMEVVTTKKTDFDEDPNLFWGPFMTDPESINSQTVGGGVATFGVWEFRRS